MCVHLSKTIGTPVVAPRCRLPGSFHRGQRRQKKEEPKEPSDTRCTAILIYRGDASQPLLMGTKAHNSMEKSPLGLTTSWPAVTKYGTRKIQGRVFARKW